MSVRLWFRPPRSLLVLFLGSTLILLSGLGWLGVEKLDQERAVEVQRMREGLDRSADVIAADIRQNLSEIEEQLTRLSVQVGESLGTAASNLATNLGDDALIVVFEPNSVRAYPMVRLLYYPVLPVPDEPPPETFATGEAYEIRAGDYQRAIQYFRQLAETSDVSIRAGALLRLARNQRKAGLPDAALETYNRLADVKGFLDEGKPAELVARRARCDLLKTLGRHEQFAAEARTLDGLIQSGRWLLTGPVYTLYTNEVRNWLTSDEKSGSAASAVATSERGARGVAAAVDSLWTRWLKDPQGEDMLTGRQSLLLEGQMLSLFWSGTGNRLVALIAGTDFVQRHMIDPSESLIARQGVGILLSDSQGAAVASAHVTGLEHQESVSRLSSDTKLPWNLRVTNTVADESRARLAGRRQMLFAGLGFAALLVAAMGYFSARAIAKESEAARLQSDFVAAVSHEFRTPLTSMRQFTSMLSEGRVSNDEERGKYYEALSRGTQRLTRLVENLLDFGRLEAGSHGYNMERINAKDWIERITSEFQEEVERRGYHIELKWNAPEESLLRADDAALGRAIWNLLDNAVKYSPESKTIWVEGRVQGSFLILSVRDRGFGIPADEHRRIFGKFVRGTIPSGRPVRGTGLGLALVEQIVRAHGGTVSVESEVGKGSTFSMRLPKQV